jgi:hypothetical protein
MASLQATTGLSRRHAATLAAGAVVGCAVLAVVDPTDSDVLPSCPTQAIFGYDCPVCGVSRGLHALTRGRVGTALDHNVLLLVAVPIGLVMWWQWARTAMGRSAAPRTLPSWVVPVTIAVAVLFTIVRNLDVSGARWLASTA